ncbi:Non-classical export protein [Aspergillus sclerotialis]|uniref:Non-classical export protein n=1 Tax=Aspergillus sclerotialis TaxID=2070753 RepID=A0A3A2ZHH6_9EURO|nr:Non-classical export protein [Aspergillus sclerotialis]
MALTGNIIAQAFAGNPATVNYAMFAAAFSIASLFYLAPASFKVDWSGHPIIMIVLDTLNAIWFLTSGIALAARLHCRDCSDKSYTLNNEITNGSHNPAKRCREAQAVVAFLFFTWAGYTVSMVISFFQTRRYAVSAQPRTGRPRATRPMMSQV